MAIKNLFLDCQSSESSELFIVEGRSAASAVNRVRNRQYQAVFALQGKIPNSSSASGLRRALNNEHVQALLELVQSQRFSKLLILCDADADGLHARMLLTTFFQTHLADQVASQRIFHIYPPLFRWEDRSGGADHFGWSREKLKRYSAIAEVTTHFKGIASMSAESLAFTCVNFESRFIRPLLPTDDAPI